MSTTDKYPVKTFFAQEAIKKKFDELLGKRSSAFMTSVLQIVASNQLLQNADPSSIYNAACIAATLDLPINNALGFAYIVPYGKQAQFQLGYKGFIQLAQRSGQFQNISAAPIYEGQLIEQDPLRGFTFDFTVEKTGNPIGYAAYFKLLNGFEKTLYMSAEDLRQHGLKFSQTYKKGYGLWKDEFDAMAQKTVIKILLSKFAPLSIEMQTASITDQSVVNNADTLDVTYADNIEESVDPMRERIEALIKTATSTSELLEISKNLPPEYANDLDILDSIEAWKAELLIAKQKQKSNAKAEIQMQQSAQPND
jgi:recombination protein RecT